MKIYRNGQYIEVDDIKTEAPSIPYEQRVVNRIREKHSIDDELALHRKANMALSKGEELPIEFVEFNAFVEQIKAEERGVTDVR